MPLSRFKSFVGNKRKFVRTGDTTFVFPSIVSIYSRFYNHLSLKLNRMLVEIGLNRPSLTTDENTNFSAL